MHQPPAFTATWRPAWLPFKTCLRAQKAPPGSAAKTGANFRPQKRLHRTVFRACLLSKQEQKTAVYATLTALLIGPPAKNFLSFALFFSFATQPVAPAYIHLPPPSTTLFSAMFALQKYLAENAQDIGQLIQKYAEPSSSAHEADAAPQRLNTPAGGGANHAEAPPPKPGPKPSSALKTKRATSPSACRSSANSTAANPPF